MRVTHVITRLIVGGAQENTIASVLGLREKYGVDTRLLSGPTSGPEGSLEGSIRDFSGFSRVPHLVRPVSPWHDVLAWRQLISVFRQQKPDLVHTHSGKAGILGRLAAHRAAVPLLVHTIHGPSFGDFQGRFSNILFKTAERSVANITSHFVVVANAMRQQYLAAGISRPEKYTRIFSGFDLGPYLEAKNDLALRARYSIEPGDFVVGKVARLFKLKGHDDLLDVAPVLVKQYPALKFLLVGDGPWRERLEARAQQLGLGGRFVFTGLVPPSEVPRLIGIMDVLVHLSRREGLARALPQALAASVPVVAYDADGSNEVCLEGQTGFLITPGNLDQLRMRLLQLANNADLRRQLGRKGQDLVREQFPVNKMVADLYGLYQRLLTKQTNGGSSPTPMPS